MEDVKKLKGWEKLDDEGVQRKVFEKLFKKGKMEVSSYEELLEKKALLKAEKDRKAKATREARRAAEEKYSKVSSGPSRPSRPRANKQTTAVMWKGMEAATLLV